jgi:hypothetical protein
MKKLLFIVGLAASALLLTGCGTLLLSLAPSTKTFTTSKTSKIVAEDQLYAVGRIEGGPILQAHPNAVAMVGRNAVYILVRGGEKFVAITQKLDGQRLFSADATGKKLTTEVPFEIAVNEGQFGGHRKFFYDKPKAELTHSEIEAIKKADAYFIGEQGATLTVDFGGFIPKVPVELKGDQSQFKAERKIILRETERIETTVPNLEKFIALPIVIAIDLITLPFQAIFFAIDYSSR